MGSSLTQASQEGWNSLVFQTNTLVFLMADIKLQTIVIFRALLFSVASEIKISKKIKNMKEFELPSYRIQILGNFKIY